MLILAVIFVGWSLTLAVAVGIRMPLSTVIYNAVPGMLNGMQNTLYAYLGPYPWDYLIQPILDLPAWMPPLGAAVLMVIAHGIAKSREW